MTELVWSRWVSLIALRPADVPSLSGVYQIRWAEDGVPKAISRAGCVDNSGCLYIGSTVNLQKRIRHLKRGILHGDQSPNVANIHTAAYTYTVFRYKTMFPPEELEIRWTETPRSQRKEYEANLLSEYSRSYLDKPPLNSQVKRVH